MLSKSVVDAVEQSIPLLPLGRPTAVALGQSGRWDANVARRLPQGAGDWREATWGSGYWVAGLRIAVVRREAHGWSAAVPGFAWRNGRGYGRQAHFVDHEEACRP